MEINPLIPIGAKIKVDKSKIENLLQKKTFDDLPKLINGEIVDYKMTDGMGIGYVLMTNNNQKIWIFSSELNEQTKKDYAIYAKNYPTKTLTNGLVLQLNKVDYEIDGSRTIKTIANPINLINWLLFTMKDIF